MVYVLSHLLDEVKNLNKYKGNVYNVGGGIENEVNLLQVLKFLNYTNYSFGEKRIGDVKRFFSDN